MAVPVEELRGQDMASSAVVIPLTQFNDEVLLQLATEYLSRFQGVRLLQIGIYTDDNTARDSKGKTAFHVTYDYWKREFEKRAKRKSICAAVLLKYGNSATLRIRHADGEIKEIKIADDNAFHPALGGLTLHLLHVSFVNQGFGDAKQLIPHFYFSLPKKISPDEAEMLAKAFLVVLGVSTATLNFREDEWYIFDTFYPWLNPFTKAETPPTPKEAAKSVEFLCTPAREVACFQSSRGTRHATRLH